MSSSESDDENNEVSNQELDVRDKLKGLLNARNKVMRRKTIELPNPIVEDVDISDILDDDSTSQIRLHQKLKDKQKFLDKMLNDVRELEQSSGNSVTEAQLLLKNLNKFILILLMYFFLLYFRIKNEF